MSLTTSVVSLREVLAIPAFNTTEASFNYIVGRIMMSQNETYLQSGPHLRHLNENQLKQLIYFDTRELNVKKCQLISRF